MNGLLERAAVLRENYVGFLRKLKDAELSESLERAQQGDRVSVLDPAFPPSAPEDTPFKMAVLGIVASLGLAGLLGLVLEARDPLAGDRGSLEALGIPVLGTVPRIG
jgi:uncharacterized protein involved in exopolysaccharide biosynthesis